MPPCTYPADSGPAGRRCSGSMASVAGSRPANWRARAIRGRNATQRRSPNWAAAIASAAWAAARRTGTSSSASSSSAASSSATWRLVTAATTMR